MAKQNEFHQFIWEHLILDFRWATKNLEYLQNPALASELVKQLTDVIEATLLDIHYHNFQGGLSILGILEESHISIHTYPEYQGAMIDIFTCGTNPKPFKAREFLLDFFKPQKIDNLHHLKRGHLG